MNTKASQTPANVLISSYENALKDVIFYHESMLFCLPLGIRIAFVYEIIEQ